MNSLIFGNSGNFSQGNNQNRNPNIPVYEPNLEAKLIPKGAEVHPPPDKNKLKLLYK
jgi:hypothetical protein